MARLLYRGCEPGMDVMELQEGLNIARQAVGEGSAFGTLTVDGAFGPMTHNRVLEFQRGHALTPDGVVGGKTWGMLEVVLSGVPGLEVRRPMGGGGNPGAGTGKGGPAYGKPEPGAGKMDVSAAGGNRWWEPDEKGVPGGGTGFGAKGGGSFFKG